MENTLIFSSDEEVRFGKLLKYIIPTYLTSLFNTVYTIIDGIFVSAYVGTDALAAINIVYPLVNVLTGIALAFATGGSAVAALHIGGGEKIGQIVPFPAVSPLPFFWAVRFPDYHFKSVQDPDPVVLPI